MANKLGQANSQELRRNLVIELLVINCIDNPLTYRCSVWLQSMLEKGFVSYEKMSEEQLERECALRGVKWGIDFFDDPIDEEFDDDEEEDDEVRGLSVRAGEHHDRHENPERN